MQFLQVLQLDKILIIPANYAQSKVEAAAGADRLAMCTLACDGYAKLEVCDLELKHSGAQYTVDTLQEIAESYKNSALFLLMGSDVFASISYWYKFDEIKTMAALCAAPRFPGELSYLYEIEKRLREKGAQTTVIQTAVTMVSSTQIRSRIQKHEPVGDLLDSKVERYIVKQGLYQYSKPAALK